MTEPQLLVPCSFAQKPFELCTVELFESTRRLSWIPIYGGDKDALRKLEALRQYIEKETGTEPAGRLISITPFHKNKNEKIILNNNTPSLFLSVYIKAFEEVLDRKFRKTWDYIIITGDIEPIDGKIKLKAVGEIKEKFISVKKHSKNNLEKKILFIYIYEGNTLPVKQGRHDKENIEVRAFRAQDSLGRILACIFEPNFNDEQLTFFKNTGMERRWEYISTPIFEEMKNDALMKNWEGFFIYGERESGKSALAFELAKFLVEAEIIYAPIWVTIDNNKIKYIETSYLSDSFKNNPLQEISQKENPLITYLTTEISKSFNLEQAFPSALNRENSPPYLLIIDNLELDFVVEVINAVKILLKSLKNKIPVIITSSFDEIEAGYAYRELGIKSIRQKDFSYDEVKALIDSVSKEQGYEQHLIEKTNSEEYETFIWQLYKHFSPFPGIIIRIVPQISRQNLFDINQRLTSMNTMQYLQEKINGIFHIIFSELNDFSKAVFFAIIRRIAESKFEENEDNKEDRRQRVAKWLYYSDLTIKKEDVELRLPEISEEIPEAEIELMRCNLLDYSEDSKTGYTIKDIVYRTFLFEEVFEGDILPSGRSLRDTIFFPHSISYRDIIYAGFWFNQSVSRIRSLLQKFTDEHEKSNEFAFLSAAASFSDNPEHIDLLLEFGYDLNSKWSWGGNGNAIQCAVAHNNNASILLRLINRGANLNIKDENGLTLLHLAAGINSNPEIIAILIENGLDMYAVDKKKRTPFEYSTQNPNLSIFELFLEKGAKFDTILESGITLIGSAVAGRSLNILNRLISLGLDVNETGKTGISPLHMAVCIENNIEIIDFLLKNGAEIDAVWKQKFFPRIEIEMTPLHLTASMNKTTENIDFLIKKGADINHKTKNGTTPILTAASFNENPQVAITLIKAGARLDDVVTGSGIFSWQKETALKCLKKRKDWPLIKAAIEEVKEPENEL